VRWSCPSDGLTLTYSFDTQQEETGIAALLRKLGDHSIDFKDLRTSESSLEDIFVSLVSKPVDEVAA
jgi:ABC-2 type transport system ATP-binding protein